MSDSFQYAVFTPKKKPVPNGKIIFKTSMARLIADVLQPIINKKKFRNKFSTSNGWNGPYFDQNRRAPLTYNVGSEINERRKLISSNNNGSTVYNRSTTELNTFTDKPDSVSAININSSSVINKTYVDEQKDLQNAFSQQGLWHSMLIPTYCNYT